MKHRLATYFFSSVFLSFNCVEFIAEIPIHNRNLISLVAYVTATLCDILRPGKI